ncbi:MAG: hypothetical protein A3H97_16310 [Acidobacteria bacterium RIFCSPLOWO2_02_FULL_65_29]|nr:MAG: hypothetical protein A3H97_16310 [Acidobacteria bacterium RIFCSPLOWO2_02_FULL_65_29]
MSATDPTPPGARHAQYRRERVRVAIGMLAVSAAAWLYMLLDAHHMRSEGMADMWMPPTGGGAWSARDFAGVFFMWSVMMVAMMMPSATPAAVMFTTVNRQRALRSQNSVSTAYFAAGYLTAWVAFSALLTLGQWPLHYFSLLTPMMDNDSRWLAGGVLALAGLYQWTPWKDACLNQCRSPMGFLLTRWREGRAGAVLMGLDHGAFCVGCCFALMAMMFAVGVMNMLWTVLIALFVLGEKVFPLDTRTLRHVSGLAFLLWGGWLIASAPTA